MPSGRCRPRAAVVDAHQELDARQVEPGRWEVFTHGGRRATGIDALEHAARLAGLGAGELLVTSMDRDGDGNLDEAEFANGFGVRVR